MLVHIDESKMAYFFNQLGFAEIDLSLEESVESAWDGVLRGTLMALQFDVGLLAVMVLAVAFL